MLGRLTICFPSCRFIGWIKNRHGMPCSVTSLVIVTAKSTRSSADSVVASRRAGNQGHSETLRLHEPVAGESYQLGVFLVGAYQEILGDLHNLFGDTHAVHVDCEGSVVKVRSIVKGDSVSEVLGYVQYDDRELLDRIGQSVEDAVSAGMIDNHQAGRIASAFEKALAGYTYLNSCHDSNAGNASEVTMRFDASHDSQMRGSHTDDFSGRDERKNGAKATE